METELLHMERRITLWTLETFVEILYILIWGDAEIYMGNDNKGKASSILP